MDFPAFHSRKLLYAIEFHGATGLYSPEHPCFHLQTPKAMQSSNGYPLMQLETEETPQGKEKKKFHSLEKVFDQVRMSPRDLAVLLKLSSPDHEEKSKRPEQEKQSDAA